MDHFKRFNFLFAAPVFDTDDLEGVRFNQMPSPTSPAKAPCTTLPGRRLQPTCSRRIRPIGSFRPNPPGTAFLT